MTQCRHVLALLCGWLLTASNALLLDIYIINGERSACPTHYYKVRTTGGLNGDLNQGAGGDFIYLCVLYGAASDFHEAPIQRLAVVTGGSGSNCGGWKYASHSSSSNGDLNQGAGGNYIFLCYLRGNSQPLDDLYLTEGDCGSPYNRIQTFGAGGDLNRGSGGKFIFVCQRLACLAEKVTGEWKPMYAVAAPTTESWMHGTSKTNARSKTEDWSTSVTETVSAGFELEGISGSAEISAEFAHSTSETYSSEWSTDTEDTFTVSWGAEDVGKMSWQFNFAPYDSCGHTEVTLTREKALTEGRWRPPCCLPGYSTDAPFYSKCHSAGVMMKGGASYGCTVATALEVSEYLQSLNRTTGTPKPNNLRSMHGSAGNPTAVVRAPEPSPEPLQPQWVPEPSPEPLQPQLV